MLSSLVPHLLPDSFTSLFDPPLDASKLHVSLITGGKVELAEIKINTSKVNSNILSPLSMLHLKSCHLHRLTIEVDWSQIRTRPLRIGLDEVRIVLTHNTIEQRFKEETREKERQKASPSSSVMVMKDEEEDAERKVRSSTDSLGQGGSTESTFKTTRTEEDIMVQSAIEAKRVALEMAFPNALNMTAPASGFDLSALSFNVATKKLISILIRALNIDATNIQIEYEHEVDDEPADDIKPLVSSSTTTGGVTGAEPSLESKESTDAMTPSVPTIASITEGMRTIGLPEKIDKPTTLGITIGGVKLESFKSSAEELGLPSQMNMIKQFRLSDLSIWCDSAAGDVSKGKTTATADETKSNIEKGATGIGIGQSHDYILPPQAQEIHFASNSSLDVNLELMLKMLSSTTLMHVRPDQLQSIIGIFSSIQKHAAAGQARLESVAARYFRSATAGECDRYIELFRQKLAQRTLNTSQQAFIDQVERDVSFADLVAMRAMSFTRLHLTALAFGIEESEESVEESTTQEKKPSVWESLWSYTGLIDESEKADTDTTAASDVNLPPPSGPLESPHQEETAKQSTVKTPEEEKVAWKPADVTNINAETAGTSPTETTQAEQDSTIDAAPIRMTRSAAARNKKQQKAAAAAAAANIQVP